MEKPLLLDKSIEQLEVLFRFTGMILIRKPKYVILDRCLFLINFLVVLLACTSCAYYTIIAIADGQNFVEVTSVAPSMICASLGIFKSIFHVINEGEVHKFIALLRGLEENKCGKCLEKQKIVDEEITFLNKVIKLLSVLNCLMMIVYDVTPMVIIAVKYFRNNSFEMLLPYLDVFIFSFVPRELKYWYLSYIHQIWAEFAVLITMAAVDFLFYTCCTYLRVQFRLLKYDIESIIPKVHIPDDSCSMYKKVIQDKFRELVQWHQKLMSLSAILEKIYSKSLLVNFLVSSILICITGFNVAVMKNIVEIIPFITFLFMGLLQVFFLCFYADMMTSASEDVSNGVYNCDWYDANPAVGKQLLMVQMMAQKPCQLTAAGFAVVDMRAFMRVVSTAWSYFALLQTMYNE